MIYLYKCHNKLSVFPYLSAECLVLQVSGRFEGSTAESHTGEHADAGIHHLKMQNTLYKI